jgi:homoserine O-acetyltransferase
MNPAIAERAAQRVTLFDRGDPLRLSCGRDLAPVEVAFETYGTLNPERSNAVFVCHALTGDAHVGGDGGWWEAMVGPGRPIDTERFFVISPNLLGGCRGTTGPSSVDPATGRAYGLRFPPITVADLVAVHRRLLDHLGIDRLHAAIGGSLGGMQIIQWLIDAPGQICHASIIGASSRLSAQNLALSAVAREAILRDPNFHDGDYAEFGVRPDLGLSIARRLAHITYLSEPGMTEKFDRAEPSGWDSVDDAGDWLSSAYDVESYLDHQAEIFLDRFDALTYLYLTRVMDAFDPFARPVRLDLRTRAQVISFDSDWRFGEHHSDLIADELRVAGLVDVERRTFSSTHGHDAFLLPVREYLTSVSEFVGSR